ncbi:uncharacterized protein LOC141619873 [Silene latifolia]|uniref:uncharacterized protein LOC141619873 n=1 Tax=Silene latifolia TaxID=37657 RepID=UPI003D776A5D
MTMRKRLRMRTRGLKMKMIKLMAGAGRGRKRGGGSGGGQSTRPEQEEEFVQEDPMQADGEETDATDEPPRVPIRYTSDHKMILEPAGLWFMDDCVVRGVTKSTKTNFVGPIPTSWTQASQAQRDAWFNNFRVYIFRNSLF